MMNKDFVLKGNDRVYYRDMFGVNCFHNVHLALDGRTIKDYERIKNIKVMKVERTITKVVYKRKEILDDVEKEYLSNALKPFRCRVISVEKDERYPNKEYIYVELTTDNQVEKDYMIFPDFKKGTMYKDMETDKKYTLEELGL